MGKIIAGILGIALAVSVQAQTFTSSASLAWDYAAEDEAFIDGFRIYSGGDLLLQVEDPTARQVPVTDLQLSRGIYALTATAYNAAGESAPSGPLSASYVDAGPGAGPGNLRIE